MSIIQGINLLNYFTTLLLLSGADYLTVFKSDQLYALVMLFFNAHEYVTYIWGLFFGFHLFVLGYLVYKSDLVYKSGYITKILGVLLMIGCFGYLIYFFTLILFPDFDIAIGGITGIGEVLSIFWLLFFAGKTTEMKSRN